MAHSQAPAIRARPPAARPAIRWDRVGRVALLAMFAVIVLLYISPVKHWIEQSRTAEEQRQELQHLEQENRRLEARAGELRRPDAIEREARKLGMIEQGERAFSVENLPPR